VEDITLWLFGGVARLRGEAPSPGAELRIAGVGPLVSLVLGAVFGGIAALVRVVYHLACCWAR
jgi:Zn-dependent protease